MLSKLLCYLSNMTGQMVHFDHKCLIIIKTDRIVYNLDFEIKIKN